MAKTEGKILQATIDCIEKYGLEKTTIRQIAKEASMNSAAINYYFRSKDLLMKQVMTIALGHAFDMENFKGSADLPAKERLVAVMDGMLIGAQQYPRLTKAFFLDLLLERGHNTLVLQHCQAFLDILKQELTAAYPRKSAEGIGEALMSISSATFLYQGLFPGFFAGDATPDLSDSGQRNAYVRRVVDAYFKEDV